MNRRQTDGGDMSASSIMLMRMFGLHSVRDVWRFITMLVLAGWCAAIAWAAVDARMDKLEMRMNTLEYVLGHPGAAGRIWQEKE